MTKAPNKALRRDSDPNAVRRKAVEEAELQVLDRNTVVIPAKDWEAFQNWLGDPPRWYRRLLN
jgi:hypothetical protein